MKKGKRIRVQESGSDSEDTEDLTAKVANYKLMASLTATELATASSRSTNLQHDLETVQASLEESVRLNDEQRQREESMKTQHAAELRKQREKVERMREEQTKRLLHTHREQV